MNKLTPIATFSFPRSGRNFCKKCFIQSGYVVGDPKRQNCDLLQTHDFGVNEEYPNRVKIVYARNPIYCFASWFEMNASDGGRADLRDVFIGTVKGEWVSYWRNFFVKHIKPMENVFWFDIFTNDPCGFIDSINKLTGQNLKKPTIVANPPRDIRKFKYYGGNEIEEIKKLLQPQYDQFVELETKVTGYSI